MRTARPPARRIMNRLSAHAGQPPRSGPVTPMSGRSACGALVMLMRPIARALDPLAAARKERSLDGAHVFRRELGARLAVAGEFFHLDPAVPFAGDRPLRIVD